MFTDTFTRADAATLTTLPGFDMPVRAAAPDAAYSFRGIGVPWNQEITIWGEREMFAPGAIVESDGALIFWRHDEPVGRMVAQTNTAAGWQIDGLLSSTPRAEEARTLLRDGVITKLSVRFEPLEWTESADGVRTYTKARVREISLVPFPAYDLAAITDVRHQQTETSPRMTPEQIAALAALNADKLARDQAGPGLARADLDAVSEQVRALDAHMSKIASGPAPIATQFRSSGDFLKALATGDADAAELHRAYTEQSAAGDDFRRAYTGSTSADTVTPNTWLSDEIRLIENRRKVTNTFSRVALPAEGLTLEYLKIGVNSIAIGKQAAQGDDLALGKITLVSATAPVETYGGYTQLTRQTIERSTAPMLDTAKRALDLEYARSSEKKVRDTLLATIAARRAIAGGAGVVSMKSLATTTLADWVSLLIDAAERYEDQGHALTGVEVSKDVFKYLANLQDGSGARAMNVFGTGMNQTGSIDALGLEGNLANLSVKLLAGAPVNTAAFYDPLALTTWEQPGAPMQLQDENILNLSSTFSVYGYGAVASQFPEAIVPVAFAATV
jgi:hypothetical protein